MVKHCDESNLLVKPQRGKALLWYNHDLDGSRRWIGGLDPFSYQGSCEVKKGEKWVAKIWININGDGKNELRAWKMGHNWLAENNRNEEIITALRTEVSEDATTENKYARDKNNVFENKEVKVEASGDATAENIYTRDKNRFNNEEMKLDVTGDATNENKYAKDTNGFDNEEVSADVSGHATTENKYAKDTNGFDNEEATVEVSDDVNNEDGASSKKDFDIQNENVKSDENPDTKSNKEIAGERSPKTTPEGPKLSRTETSSPLPLTEEQMTPKGPSVGYPPPQGFEGNRIIQSIMLLLEELDQVELEIIARNLHTKLKLVCVPLIVNPMGRL